MARKAGVLKKHAPKDFEKIRSKVGKKKQAARNDTKTDFKVKQLQMPAQKALLSEKGEEVTSRNLTLSDILAHMQHHSSKVRRESFDAIRELCTSHPGVLKKSLARIVDATTTAPIDSYAEVRRAFLAFQAWLIGAVPPATLLAFASTLTLYVRSALSHVSSEVREDGLALLELYLQELGGLQLFNQAEVAHLIDIMCQLVSEMDSVLPCLYELLGELAQADGPASESRSSQVSIDSVLQGRFQLPLHVASGPRAQPVAGATPQEAASDSPLWSYCLRAWLQAGELPYGLEHRGAAAEAAGRPGRLRLLAAAVLERSMDYEQRQPRSAVPGEDRSGAVALLPSPSQVSALVGIVRRGEWPARVDPRGTFRPLADAINLRMARVLALVARSGGAASAQHLARLASAAVAYVEEVARPVAASAEAVASAPGRSAPGGQAVVQRLLIGGASGAQFVLRTLDLLWAGCADDDFPRLLAATSCFAGAGCDEALSASAALASPALLAAPLAASLLGLRPCAAARASAVAGAAAPLQAAWPEALSGLGEPSLAARIESEAPGAARRWVSAWPRLLFYLGAADPAASSFLLSLLLELAKQAAMAGSLQESLFVSACPLLVPFIVGRPSAALPAEQLPPITQLPDDPGGPQGLAAMLVQHFPKLPEPVFRLLARLVCGWSIDSTGLSAAVRRSPHLGVSASDLLLTSLLQRGVSLPADAREHRLVSKLRVVVSVLSARPMSGRAPSSDRDVAVAVDTAMLRLVRVVADWLMNDDGAAEASGVPDLETRKRLALEVLAWPVCLEVLPASKNLGPRLVCFLFFCTLSLPPCGVAGGAAGAGDPLPEALLGAIFDACVLGPGGSRSALYPDVEGGVLVAASVLPALQPSATAGGSDRPPLADPGGREEAQRLLARLLVAAWMRIAGPARSLAAHALLARRCAAAIAAEAQQLAATAKAKRRGAAVPALACAAVLEEALAFGSARGLRLAAADAEGLGGEPSAPRLRAQLDLSLEALAAEADAHPCWSRLRASLPLL